MFQTQTGLHWCMSTNKMTVLKGNDRNLIFVATFYIAKKYVCQICRAENGCCYHHYYDYSKT